ncbi:MAG: serine/threonine-protein kinase [Myxococcota bacterium]
MTRFTMLEPVGRGGMGTVYAAYDERLDRKVAVKVLRRDELPDERDRARFVREAQALARLSHPHVVTVHEVGEANGELFLAMEFIRGQDLGQWLRADSAGPGWRAVLEAFVQAGEGLAAVHLAGLVHRDLKPHNIMRRDDGTVKLLDFGLARAVESPLDSPLDALGSSRGEQTPAEAASPERSATDLSCSLTRPGTLVGTPAYMSPEQIRAEPVDARSDQFSFCVALYEAVYGERPYPGTTMKALGASILEGRIRLAPKDRLAPARLRSIVLRGLAADPHNRWPSMEALVEQLRQLLVPRRGRWLALGGSLALGLGLVGLGQTYRADVEQRCTGARDRLDGIWDDARRQAVEAAILGTARPYGPETWERVEPRLDAYADAWVDQHTEVCEATVVRREQSEAAMRLRMRCLEERRTSLRASIEILAKTQPAPVDNAIEVVAGLPPLIRCDDLGWLEQQDQRMPPPEDPVVAAQVDLLRERLAEISPMVEASRNAEALEALEPVVRRAEALDYPPLLAEAHYWRGVLRSRSGEYTQAEQDLRRAYVQALEHHHDRIVLDTAQWLAFVVGYQLARYDEGQRWGEMTALPLARSGGDPDQWVESLNSLGMIASARGEYEDARDYYERALAIWDKAKGTGHPKSIMLLSNLAIVRSRQGEHEDAQQHHERALRLKEKAYGANHPRVAGTLTNLGTEHGIRGEYDEARRYYERAREIVEKALGADHPRYAMILENLGITYRYRGLYEDAKHYQEQALRIFETALGADHPSVAKSLVGLGHVHRLLGKYDDAKTFYQRARRILETVVGAASPPHPLLADPLIGLAITALAKGDPQAARAPAERAVALREAATMPPELLAEARFVLARALWSDRRQRARARALAEQARDDRPKTEGPGEAEVDLGEIDAWLATHRIE